MACSIAGRADSVMPADDDGVVGPDADIRGRRGVRAAKKHGGAHEQERGRRDLAADQHLANAARTCVSRHFAAHRPHQLEARRVQRRGEAEHDGRDERAAEEERQHAPVAGRDSQLPSPSAPRTPAAGCSAPCARCRPAALVTRGTPAPPPPGRAGDFPSAAGARSGHASRPVTGGRRSPGDATGRAPGAGSPRWRTRSSGSGRRRRRSA